MEIQDILNKDFSSETDYYKLIDAINQLQHFCKEKIINKKNKFESHESSKDISEIFVSLFDDSEELFTEIWEKDWFIFDDGTIKSKSAGNFSISKDELTQQNWISYILLEKDFNGGEASFYFAYLEALKICGFKKIEIDINTDKIKVSSNLDNK